MDLSLTGAMNNHASLKYTGGYAYDFAERDL